jgi:hypothetical protein
MDFPHEKPYIFMSWKCGLCLLAGMVKLVFSLLGCTEPGGRPLVLPTS